jgi:DNA-binding protein HU-beta
LEIPSARAYRVTQVAYSRAPVWQGRKNGGRDIAVNKGQLVDAVAERLGDKKTAAAAVEAVVDVIVRSVAEDESVTIPGFGVFERRARAARTARNPRTGEAVEVAETAVPAFRPGATFKGVLAGTREPPTATVTAGAGSSGTTRANGNGRAGTSGSPGRAPAGSAGAAKSAAKTAEARKAADARKTAAVKTAAKKGTARKKQAK